MKLSVVFARDAADFGSAACLALPVTEGSVSVPVGVSGGADQVACQSILEARLVTGKPEEVYFVPSAGGTHRGVLLFGIGKPGETTPEQARRTAGVAACRLRENKVTHLVLDASSAQFPVHAFLEGLMFGQYDFRDYKKSGDDAPVYLERFTVLVSDATDAVALNEKLARTALIAGNTNLARDLANRASNDLTPSALAEFAEDMARELGCKSESLDEDDMSKLGMNALLGVAKGSAERSKLIIVRYTHSKDAPTLAIVGKGITFDSGGISIKPAMGMHEMKFDMCGAAAVLGAFKSIAELKAPINVVALVPAAENMTGSAAQKPGDIVRAFNGTTIEVHNTDAEGRLVLADALAYAVKTYQPAAMVDLATLTGACVVALGYYAAGTLTNNDALLAELQQASDRSGERIWPLPLWDDYCALIKGTHADLCNIGPKGEAGAIMGAAFLKEFVDGTPWAHLDIAGTAWGGKKISYQNPDFATGYGVRLLTEWILARAQTK